MSESGNNLDTLHIVFGHRFSVLVLTGCHPTLAYLGESRVSGLLSPGSLVISAFLVLALTEREKSLQIVLVDDKGTQVQMFI